MSGRAQDAGEGGAVVMVLEPDVLVRPTTAHYLRLGGVRVVEAADVEEAIIAAMVAR